MRYVVMTRTINIVSMRVCCTSFFLICLVLGVGLVTFMPTGCVSKDSAESVHWGNHESGLSRCDCGARPHRIEHPQSKNVPSYHWPKHSRHDLVVFKWYAKTLLGQKGWKRKSNSVHLRTVSIWSTLYARNDWKPNSDW